MMLQPKVPQSFHPAHGKGWTTQTDYAGLFKRGLAFIVDMLVIQILKLLLNTFFGVNSADVAYQPEQAPDNWMMLEFLIALNLAIYLAYATFLECSPLQATLGKYLLQIEVTDLEGNKIDIGRALLRNFIKFFSIIFIGIGYLILPFTPTKQTLHDLLSGCRVVRVG